MYTVISDIYVVFDTVVFDEYTAYLPIFTVN